MKTIQMTIIQFYYLNALRFSGLKYLHDRNIVHGDIKPQNVLLKDDISCVKLCDFGLSRLKTKIKQTTTKSFIEGTESYMAPETKLNGVKPNFATDVWCLGASLIELYIQRDCWDEGEKDDDDNEVIKKFMKEKIEPHGLVAVKGKNELLYQKLKPLFHYSPGKRPTAAYLASLW